MNTVQSPVDAPLALPSQLEVTRALEANRSMHQRVLAAWTGDMLTLRRVNGTDLRWNRHAASHTFWNRAA